MGTVSAGPNSTIRRELRERPLTAIPPELDAHYPPLLAGLYARRGVDTAAELDVSLAALPRPERLPDIDTAVDLLVDALARQERIVIVGDYDADGATSTALMMEGLGALGGDVDFVVPDRFVHGYGLSPPLVDLACERGAALILTVDNGVASFAGIARAHERGLRVLVTDHHLPGDALPPADALVNPALPDADFPGRALAGVGVAFYLLIALRARLRGSGGAAAERAGALNVAALLDLVALGTVADLVPLDAVNRVLVAQGVRRIRSGQARPGIAALLAVAGRDPAQLVATDLGYNVGPRLNAAGRLADMTLGIRCLLAPDEASAQPLARELDRFNRERRNIEADMQKQALDDLDESAWMVSDNARMALTVFDVGWHEGVVGLLASRLKERCHRPVVAFAPAGEGGAEATLLKGSGRSVPGLHLRDALARLDVMHPGLIERFGGHAMAAGLSLPRAHLAQFRDAFEAVVRETLPVDALAPVIWTDGELPGSALTLENAGLLANAGPFGQGFPPPLFHGDFDVVECRRVGSDRSHLRLRLRHPGIPRPLDAIAFRIDSQPWHDAGTRVRIAYRPEINEFRGRRDLQLVLEYVEALD